MKRRIAKLNYKRQKNMLYYVKSDEEGYLEIYETQLMRGGRKKKNVQ